MQIKISLSALLLLIVLSCPVYAQTWTNVSPSWTAANVYAESMAVYGGNLYVGTEYTGPADTAQVWQYNGTTWTNVSPSWATGNYSAESMAVYGGNLYVGTGHYSGPAQVWQYNGTTWTNVSPSWTATNDSAQTMTVYGGNLYVGMGNTYYLPAQVWQYNGTTWTNVSPSWDATNAYALSMAVYGDNLYVGTRKYGGPAQVWQLFVQPTTATAVSTMTEWGMIVFALLAGLSSAYYLRRKKRVGSSSII